MNGRIIRIISNLYTVLSDNQTYECRARGKFKNDNITPLVGDYVVFDADMKYILEIKPRKNALSRPMIANVDLALIVSSCKRPSFSAFLLDKMLANIILNDITPIICFSKFDLLDATEQKEINDIMTYYNSIGIKAILNTEISELITLIENKTVVLCGQTGVGKSTLMNKLDSSLHLATDDISEALGRGKHTTRHVELFSCHKALIADTPGFSAFDLDSFDKKDIRFAFPEFDNSGCRFSDCMHINERDCAVLKQVSDGEILTSREESYKKMVS